MQTKSNDLSLAKRLGYSLVAAAIAAGSLLIAAERFDHKVRDKFFQGFTGNPGALAEGMKICEEILSENPKHAEALVWHGGGLLFQSRDYFIKGEREQGMALFQKGVAEMDMAVELAPKSVGVRVPRAATLAASTHQMPPQMAKPLIERSVRDYEATYEIQKDYLDKLGDHPRGELLVGLAEGHYRMGNHDQAKIYFEELVKMGPKSGHLREAKEYLETGKLSKPVQCVGCHVRTAQN